MSNREDKGLGRIIYPQLAPGMPWDPPKEEQEEEVQRDVCHPTLTQIRMSVSKKKNDSANIHAVIRKKSHTDQATLNPRAAPSIRELLNEAQSQTLRLP